MEDHVRDKDELIMPRAVIVTLCSVVRMIKPKLGTNSNELVRPPGNTDGMLGVVRGKASPAPDLVVKIFVAHGEEGIGAMRNMV